MGKAALGVPGDLKQVVRPIGVVEFDGYDV